MSYIQAAPWWEIPGGPEIKTNSISKKDYFLYKSYFDNFIFVWEGSLISIPCPCVLHGVFMHLPDNLTN